MSSMVDSRQENEASGGGCERVAGLKYGDLEDGEINIGAGAGVTGSVMIDGLIGFAAVHTG